jgi:hypothetical protein
MIHKNIIYNNAAAFKKFLKIAGIYLQMEN